MNAQKRIKLYGNIMSQRQSESAEEEEEGKKRKDKKRAIANPTRKARNKGVEPNMQLFYIYDFVVVRQCE